MHHGLGRDYIKPKKEVISECIFVYVSLADNVTSKYLWYTLELLWSWETRHMNMTSRVKQNEFFLQFQQNRLILLSVGLLGYFCSLYKMFSVI